MAFTEFAGKLGVETTFKGGKGTWTLQNGKPVRVR